MVRRGVDPLSTEGSKRSGGRYNPAGQFGAVYSSLEAKTAAAEVARSLKARGLDPATYAPDDWWVYELEVKLERALDLTNPVVLARLGLDAPALIGPDSELTRQLGAAARANGYEGVLAPSAAVSSETNLILFPENLARSPAVRSSSPVNVSD